MKRSEVRTFIETGINSLVPVVEFNEGEVGDFAAQRSNKYPSTLLLLESVDVTLNNSAPSDAWKITVAVFQIDKLDSLPEIYEDLVDNCDEMAQKLVYKYRNIVSGYKLVTMDEITRTKFVKSPKYGPDCLTGVELVFNLRSPDQTTCP